MFMGYSYIQKGYLLLKLKTKIFFVNRDVLFHETVFHFSFLTKHFFIFPTTDNSTFLHLEPLSFTPIHSPSLILPAPSSSQTLPTATEPISLPPYDAPHGLSSHLPGWEITFVPTNLSFPLLQVHILFLMLFLVAFNCSHSAICSYYFFFNWTSNICWGHLRSKMGQCYATRNFFLWKLMVRGRLFLYLLVRFLSGENGFVRSSITLMAPLNGLKLEW